ncbi:hypothetical protein [Haloarchaeobius sp. DFWS5]|uniref:hypothetical protein n=1 Tax=Haloarchaeobius sp. DFWS5 TaxID=3446114 RepID=UPI003EB8E45C
MDSTNNSRCTRRSLIKTVGLGLLSLGGAASTAGTAAASTGSAAASNYYGYRRGYGRGYAYSRRYWWYNNAFEFRIFNYGGTGTAFDFDSTNFAWDTWVEGTDIEWFGPYGPAVFEVDYDGFRFTSLDIIIECDSSGLDVEILDGPSPIVNFQVDEADGELDITYADGGRITVDSPGGGYYRPYYGRRRYYY